VNLALVAGVLSGTDVPVPVTVRIGESEPQNVGHIAVRFEVDADPDDPARLVAVCRDEAGLREQVAELLDRAAADLRAQNAGEVRTDAAAR
jgi:hypothetical protein